MKSIAIFLSGAVFAAVVAGAPLAYSDSLRANVSYRLHPCAIGIHGWDGLSIVFSKGKYEVPAGAQAICLDGGASNIKFEGNALLTPAL